ncbi:MAG TPA: SpoIID/LytB domain-containing protein [Fibrobacteraceae bacterium]|nr:SpoIID/LytB domain-containing protein [Fibrobacteraceae bacterium]
MPESRPEPSPSASTQTSPSEDWRLHPLSTPPLPEFSSTSSSSVVIRNLDPLPSFDGPLSSSSPSKASSNGLPEFGEEIPLAAPLVNFVREPIPEMYRRDIRVGLTVGKRVQNLGCDGFCRVTLEPGSRGRVSNTLRAEISGKRLILSDPEGHRYSSNTNVVRLEAWEPGGLVRLDGKNYRGILEVGIYNGALRVVNELPVESYLQGVVPNEIGHLDSTMVEALKAQAVAARTYAYRHYLSRSSQGFDVYADVRDQVYQGVDGESSLANQAILASSGVVILWNHQLIEAYYHSTCGGQTESVSTWKRNPVPYLRPVVDLDSTGAPWCALSSYATWKYYITWGDLSRIAKRYLATTNPEPMLNFHEIRHIKILDRNPGGRVGRLEVSTDRGVFLVTGDKTRWFFRDPRNPEKILPSAWFEMEQNSQGITLRGRGFGHGIGLCQMGARAMAKAGRNYKDILQHYYSGVELSKWQ